MEKTVIEKDRKHFKRFHEFFQKLRQYVCTKAVTAFDADVRALLEDVEKLYDERKCRYTTDYNRLMEEGQKTQEF